MIDENRVRLMTKLTIYEDKQKHKAIDMSRFYKRDYVRSNVLRTWVASTVVYWSVFAAYIYMHFEDVLAKINEYDYFDIMYKLLAGYVFFCAIYFVFSSLVYGYRYEKAKPGLAEYNGNLKKLIAIDSGEEPIVVDIADRVSEEVNTERNEANQRLKVNRMELMRKQQRLEEEKKEREIIENVRRRNERVAAQNENLSRQQREAEEDKRRIRERRMQLEREQMERLRKERLQRMQEINRQNHTYSDETDDGKGGEI